NGNSSNSIHKLSSTQGKTLSLPLSPKKIISQFDRKKVELFRFLFGGGLLGHPVDNELNFLKYGDLIVKWLTHQISQDISELTNNNQSYQLLLHDNFGEFDLVNDKDKE
ncbi:unnamed protein product, partial [Rotaria magnacalcarata]